MRVSADEELDVLHARRKAVEAGLLVLEQGVGRNHNLPSAVPHAAADQAGVSEFLRHGAVEHRGIRHGTERLVFADDPRLLAEGPVGVEELGGVEGRGTQVVRQRQGLVLHRPSADRVGVAEGRRQHAVVAAGDQIDIGRGPQGVGTGGVRRAGTRIASCVTVHPDITRQGDAHAVNLGRVVTWRVVVIPRRIVQPEEIQTVLDGATERNDDPRHRRSIRLGNVAAILGHVTVTRDVGHHVLLQRLLPSIIVAGRRGVVQQAEQFGAQREDRAVLVRVIDTQTALGHREVGVHLRQRSGQSGIAEGARGRLRHPAGQITQRARRYNPIEDLLPRARAQQTRLVIIALHREVTVAAGELEEAAVLFQRLVTEQTESQILGPVTLDHGCCPHPERLALRQHPQPLGQHSAHLFIGPLKLGRRSCQRGEHSGHFPVFLLHLIGQLDCLKTVLLFDQASLQFERGFTDIRLDAAGDGVADERRGL